VLTNVPAYPPFRQGLPLLPVPDIIQSQARLIREIYGAVGVSPEFWKKIYLPAIHNYAHYVHLLPASEGNHHRGAGGLFRHGLEACLYAVRLTDGQDSLEKSAHLIHPIERRRHEDALRLATFCAALFHDIGKPLVDMQVYDQAQGTIWNPSLHPSLYQWGLENHVQAYNLRWRSGRMDRHKNLGIATAPHLLTRNILAFLTDVDAYWVESVLRAISGDEMGINKVRDFATYGDRESVRYDLKNQGGEGNDIGIPVERYLLDAMRTLVREQTWKTNVNGAVLWTTTIPDEAVERSISAGTPVIALIWPKAGADVTGWLHQQGTPGIPKDPQVVADMLLDRELALPSRDESEGQQRIPFWFLSPENPDGMGNTDPIGQRVLVLRHPEYLLDIVPPLSARSLYSVRKAGAPGASDPSATPVARSAGKNAAARPTESTASPAPSPKKSQTAENTASTQATRATPAPPPRPPQPLRKRSAKRSKTRQRQTIDPKMARPPMTPPSVWACGYCAPSCGRS
jgi:Putative helicase.